MLDGRFVVVTGVATEDSIATATVRRASALGAEVRATAMARDVERARDITGHIDESIIVDELDLTDPVALEAWSDDLAKAGRPVDAIVHAVAFAPRAALSGDFVAVSSGDLEVAMRTSVWTYAALAKILVDRAPTTGASLVGLDFDAGGRAWPVYNWMGVCKAALRETSRYIARDHGAQGIRSNLVAAGPLATRAATAIPNFHKLTDAWASTAPLQWDAFDATPVADVVCFLLSPLARAITGEIVHVDGGFHAMATSIRDED